MTNEDQDLHWLRQAVELAKLCPPSDTAFSVGAVIVGPDGTVIATGHSRENDPVVHAEESALAKAGDDPRLPESTLYSTLEPCAARSSRPRTCAQLIIDSGISRVVYAWPEPTEFVSSPAGRRTLVEAGVEVVERSDLPQPFSGTNRTFPSTQ